MPTSLVTIVGMLRLDEVPYPTVAALVDDAVVDEVAALTTGADTDLAARAASLAAYLPPPLAARVCTAAAADGRHFVRAAAATALPALPMESAIELAATLLADPDEAVRVWTLRSVDRSGMAALGDRVRELARIDDVSRVRELADAVGRRLP
jgi:HEAT repeat protein